MNIDTNDQEAEKIFEKIFQNLPGGQRANETRCGDPTPLTEGELDASLKESLEAARKHFPSMAGLITG